MPPSTLIAVGSTKLNAPEPFVAIIWLADPSEFGKVNPVKTIFPVPATDNVKSAFEGAERVEPTAVRSPKLVDDPPPLPETSVPPAVTPSPILKLPESTSTA